MLLVGICGKHGDGIYIYIYILEESVMQADGAMTPCLYTALMALTTDKGGTTVGEAMAHFPLPELPPSTLAGDRATRRQGKNGPVLRACPSAHAQPEPGRPSYKSTPHTEPSNSSSKAKATRHRTRTRTPTPSRSRDVRATSQCAHGPGSCTKRGGGARCEWG